MFKKFICLFAVLCLLFSLAACSEPEETDAPDKTEGKYTVVYSVDYGRTHARVVSVDGFMGGSLVIDSEYMGLPVTTISADVFTGMKSITSVTLPDTITTIGQNAFSGCSGLKEINIPVGVQYMGQNAFKGCTELTVNLATNAIPDVWPENWNDGCKEVIFGTMSVPDFSTDNNNANNENNANNNNNDNNNNNNTQTAQYSQGLIFESYSSGSGRGYAVKSIGTCKDEHIKIPPTYKAFNDREEVPVVAISDNAFKNATFIKSVTIPDSVYKIGKAIFAGCSNIESITTPIIGADYSSHEVLGYFFGANAFDGAELISQQTMMGYNAKLQNKEYYIPTSLRTIVLTKSDYCFGMFSGCYFLTSVTLKNDDAQRPNLGSYVFNGCKGLTEIKLSGKYESIGDYAFYGCENLKSVTFDNDSSYIMLEEIGESAFDGCKALENFTIPNNVKTIGDGAFGNCESLKSITIPAGVTYVGYEAFDDGCKALTSIRVLASSTNRNKWDDRWNDTGVVPSYN